MEVHAGLYLLAVGAVVVVVVGMKAGFRALNEAVHGNLGFLDFVHTVAGELSVVGCIHVVITFCCVVGLVPHDSNAFRALDAAHLGVFYITLSLSAHVFLVLVYLRPRSTNLEALCRRSPGEVLTEAGASLVRMRHRSCLVQFYHARYHVRQLHLKVLEHYFLCTYDLPRSFSFATYVGSIQTRQSVRYILRIDPSTWTFLLFLFCIIFMGEAFSSTPQRVVAFAVLTSLLVVSTFVLHLYLVRVLDGLFRHVVGKRGDPMEAVQCLSSHQAPPSTTNESLHRLRDAAATWCIKDSRLVGTTDDAIWCGPQGAAPSPMLHAKSIQLLVRLTLVVNAFLMALLWPLVLPATTSGGVWCALSLSVPLWINLIVFAPAMVHNAAIIQAVWYVERETLLEAIEHFEEMEMLKMHVVTHMEMYMWERRLCPQDVATLIQGMAGSNDCFVDLQILQRVFQTTFHLYVALHKLKALLQVTCSVEGGSRFNIMDLVALLETRGHRGTAADSEVFL
ncbi:hypothetical protein H310_03566 [Aphanomyces invadans]|uniref:Uncharacterized protein n=1 Tax=Aphanomyces invadans TaxID=157072 RepID=A0A024UJC0_9STRA|nr:hypothetical protein H310_03566 [Aphanomyces invadans]ETW05927.1 hypothetical protein H310_03566 [Aphanomyces invadans]|eukprot:XP_008865704.1 hypothetical protein H310_03566 [Aphanomyces invadans]